MFGKLLEGKSGSAEATEAVGKVGDLHPDAPVCLAALPRVWPRRAGAGTTKGCSVAKRAYRPSEPLCSEICLLPPVPRWPFCGAELLHHADGRRRHEQRHQL